MPNRSSQLGNNIKKICLVKNNKTDDLATKIGVGTRQLQNIFNGKSDISQTNLNKIADFVEESVEDIRNWHTRSINTTIHELKENVVGVNNGTVHTSKLQGEKPDLKGQVEKLASQLENTTIQVDSLNKQMHDLRQVNDAVMTLMTTINNQIQKLR
jgi:DNA-binding Xre family transcriptional regulator